MYFTGTLLTLLFVATPSEAVSQRRIFTLFTDTKTWNEASAICESQFGQLVKIKSQSDSEEMQYLDSAVWEDRISNGSVFWSGLHQPFTNTTWEYQDCEVISSDLSFTSFLPGGKCATFDSGYDLSEANCSTENIFVCQRYVGDCWFEPFVGETYTAPIYQINTLSLGLEASDCAMECRSLFSGSNIECWGFIYDPNGAQGCQLLSLNEESASITFLKSDKTSSVDPDTIFYIRRCFEGTLDTKTYSNFDNAEQEPETICTNRTYPGEDAAANICYCSTQEQPPIPEPISSEEKAQQYVRELTIDAKNTSAASNKLNSAEDNRPSAVGVGFVGVGLLTAVFGGLFLMDLKLIVGGIKELVCSMTEVQSSAYEIQSSGYPPESEC